MVGFGHGAYIPWQYPTNSTYMHVAARELLQVGIYYS